MRGVLFGWHTPESRHLLNREEGNISFSFMFIFSWKSKSYFVLPNRCLDLGILRGVYSVLRANLLERLECQWEHAHCCCCQAQRASSPDCLTRIWLCPWWWSLHHNHFPPHPHRHLQRPYHCGVLSPSWGCRKRQGSPGCHPEKEIGQSEQFGHGF